jgi:hypothetical protein
MAYDEALATRMRALLGDAPNASEKTMFGGLAFLVRGTRRSPPAVKVASWFASILLDRTISWQQRTRMWSRCAGG